MKYDEDGFMRAVDYYDQLYVAEAYGLRLDSYYTSITRELHHECWSELTFPHGPQFPTYF